MRHSPKDKGTRSQSSQYLIGGKKGRLVDPTPQTTGSSLRIKWDHPCPSTDWSISETAGSIEVHCTRCGSRARGVRSPHQARNVQPHAPLGGGPTAVRGKASARASQQPAQPGDRLPKPIPSVTPKAKLGLLLAQAQPPVSDNALRALYDAVWDRVAATARRAIRQFWEVQVPDGLLAEVGVERLKFYGVPKRIPTVESDPKTLVFSPAAPSPQMDRGALYLYLVSCALWLDFQTNRSAFEVDGAGVYRRVGRLNGAGPHFVLPFLRHLARHRKASEDAVASARRFGVRLPLGMTFVNGHIRGKGAASVTSEWTLADLVFETLQRNKSSKPKTQALASLTLTK